MKKSEKTRRLIIEKAAVLFNQKGYAGTSMQDIMDATGLTKGGIYGNFRKNGVDKKGVKEEIAIAAFEHAVLAVNEEVRRRTHVIDNSLDKLKAVVYYYKERVMNPAIEGGCPIQNTSIEADDNQPALKEKVCEAIQYWRARIVHTINKGIEKGEIKPTANAEEFAILFIGTLEGGILMARISDNKKHFDIMADRLIGYVEELKV